MTDVMPLEHVRLVVVMPVGPGEDPVDTLESIRVYTDPSRAVVLVDDTGSDALAASVAGDPDVHVVPAPTGASGGWGGLRVTIAAGHAHACARWRSDLLARMDTDALLIGPGIEDAALRRVAEAPGLGLLGARAGPTAIPATSRRPRRRRGPRRDGAAGATRACGPAPRPARPRDGERLPAGEHALGGADLPSRAAVRSLASRGLLDMPEIADSHLGEDQVFALPTVAAGFGIGDFSRPGDPMALRSPWKRTECAMRAGPARRPRSVRSSPAARRAGTPAGG